jgi:E3 ubiquitin-protein ligase TRIP12
VGKALVDARPLDLPFSDAFIGALRGDVLDPRAAIASFDPAFARSFAQLEELVAARDAARAAGDADALARVAAQVDGALLDFTVPGALHAAFPGAPPPPAGAADDEVASVTLENLHTYVDGLAAALVGVGVAPAVHAVLRGLRAFTPDPRALLRLRTPREWRDVLSGDGALADETRWTERAVRAGLIPASHYGATSPQLDWLAAAVAGLRGPHARRLFLRFVSGAARLPPGGLRISVYSVERRDGTSDTLLPSCSTCTVSLKLPRYSNAQVLAAKLLVAIEEGQENFALD